MSCSLDPTLTDGRTSLDRCNLAFRPCNHNKNRPCSPHRLAIQGPPRNPPPVPRHITRCQAAGCVALEWLSTAGVPPPASDYAWRRCTPRPSTPSPSNHWPRPGPFRCLACPVPLRASSVAPPVVVPAPGVVGAALVVPPSRRISRRASLRYHDGLVQRSLERLVRVARGPGRGLPLPHLLGLDADVVDLLLASRLFNGTRAAPPRRSNPGRRSSRLTSKAPAW